MDPPEVRSTTSSDDALDLEEVKKLAVKEDYELIYFSKASRVVSFSSTNDIDGNIRINVYWTTGTVGTCLAHPTQGKTQLFRRNINIGELEDIFRNPRVHTGIGYHTKDTKDTEPSDITPLQSDPIDPLQEQIDILEKQIQFSRTIEVTGPQGKPVYASGLIQNGRRKNAGGLWEVDLTPNQMQDSCPISMLNDIEIRYGGVLITSAQSHRVEVLMDDLPWDNNVRKEVLFHFGGYITGIWVPIRING